MSENDGEQSIRISQAANQCASELADRFDLTRKAIMESALFEYYERHKNAERISVVRVARESRPKYRTESAT